MKYKLGQLVKSKYSGEVCKIVEIKFGRLYRYLVEMNDLQYWFYESELMDISDVWQSGFVFRVPRWSNR